jgi:hypothetical protein
VTSGERSPKLYLNITKPNRLEKHLPPFEATRTHSSSGTRGNDEVFN